jgi:CRISPR-associated protein Csd1
MILSSLVRTYERMARRGEVPVFGYSQEKISFVISLGEDGRPVGAPHDLRQSEGKKRLPAILSVPQPSKRTSGIAPNFLWDKSAYVLGVTAGEGKRTAQEHAAFIERHRLWLAGTEDRGLRAFLAFLDWWKPERFAELGWPEELRDQNIVFTLDSERLDRVFLHDRPAGRALWAQIGVDEEASRAVCLVSGEEAPIARLHPAIKGVWGAQSSGASIVSFNLDAFTSYGHEQGDNAPVSVGAAFAYTTALNTLLDRGRNQCLQIGDASVVFWAEAADDAAAEAAEDAFAAFWQVDEKSAVKPLGAWLDRIRQGKPVSEWRKDAPEGVRFHVLALAPNAARLSIRFYIADDFREIAGRYAAHQQRLAVGPPPPQGTIAFWRMAQETAVLGKRENVDPHLAGDWLRAILTGAPYPLTLLTSLIMRIRADHQINGLRVAILKSVLIRNFNREVPVSLDPAFKDPGYLLGRLFAVYEQIQVAALGTSVNATIRDKFYGAASSQPRKVFHLLDAGSANHLSKVGKQSPGRRVNLEKTLGGIMELIAAKPDSFPAHLPEQSQALFALGYYHQKNDFFRKAEEAAAKKDAAP